MNFVFDVDGTLTPSRGLIDPEFADWFKSWIKNHDVYLCTGSDYAKTLEQVGKDICESVAAVYNCAGNCVYQQGQLIRLADFKPTDEHKNFMMQLVTESTFTYRTGLHIEERPGLFNLSIVGRYATKDQRQEYYKWDQINKEREDYARIINKRFPELEATVAGEIGIDIYLKGKDKSQIAKEVEPFIFFGDSIFPGGNDYSVAQLAEKSYRVNDWRHTFSILRGGYK